jgi:hypothetical protein
MEKALYADNYLINFDGLVMSFGALKEWIGMSNIDYSDIQPASYDEAVRYSQLNVSK